MSSPAAGKFQDHYEVLAIDPKSGPDAIGMAYSKLAQKYHPSNLSSGDKDKFDAVNLAYEVLSDLQLRREFDKLKGVSDEDGPPTFSGAGFFDLLGRDNGLRAALLSVLYERRRRKPFTPSLSMRHLEGILEASEIELNFTLWYLKQGGMVESDDKSSLQITMNGINFLEANRPTAEMVMPFIKVSAITPEPGVPAPIPPKKETAVVKEEEEDSSAKPLNAAQRIMAATRFGQKSA